MAKLILSPELAEAVWDVVEPHTPGGGDEREVFVDFASRAGLGAYATQILGRDFKWYQGVVHARGGRVRLSVTGHPVPDGLPAEINAALGALFPLRAAPRRRLSALAG